MQSWKNSHNFGDGDRLTNETWSTGRAMAYGYDDAHQLTSVAASRPSDAARYRYDAAGNPVDRAELGLDVTNSFNNLNQIVTGSWTGATLTVAGSVNYPAGSISVNGQPGTVYTDSSFDVASVPVSPGTNTLTATYTGPAYTNVPMTATDTSTVVLGDTAYTHDANGNLTSDATFLYQYDLANQLTNVTRKSDSAVVLQCRYDALGRRVEAIRSDDTIDRYVYFPGSFLVLAVLDGSNTPKEFYTRGPDLAGKLDSAGGIGGILACTYSNAPSAPLFHHSDLMGNVIALTDSSTVLVSSIRYTPFGQLSIHGEANLSRHLFSSKEFDVYTCLAYYGYRYYSASLGRWLTADPIETQKHNAKHPNLAASIWGYVFCRNYVLSLFDDWGLKATDGVPRNDAVWNSPQHCFGDNCYEYAFDRLGQEGENERSFFVDPGGYSGMPPPANYLWTCDLLRERAIADGMILPEWSAEEPCCPEGYHLVYAVIGFYGEGGMRKTDYHWYRKDTNPWWAFWRKTRWSHKSGQYPVSEVDGSNDKITNPEKANHNYSSIGLPNYIASCGYLCAPNGGGD